MHLTITLNMNIAFINKLDFSTLFGISSYVTTIVNHGEGFN
jgi:hypothetical protein